MFLKESKDLILEHSYTYEDVDTDVLSEFATTVLAAAVGRIGRQNTVARAAFPHLCLKFPKYFSKKDPNKNLKRIKFLIKKNMIRKKKE